MQNVLASGKNGLHIKSIAKGVILNFRFIICLPGSPIIKNLLLQIDDLDIQDPSITNDEKLNLSLFRAELLTLIDGHHLQGYVSIII